MLEPIGSLGKHYVVLESEVKGHNTDWGQGFLAFVPRTCLSAEQQLLYRGSHKYPREGTMG